MGTVSRTRTRHILKFKRRMQTSIAVMLSLLVVYSMQYELAPLEGGKATEASRLAACLDPTSWLYGKDPTSWLYGKESRIEGDSCLRACCISKPDIECCTRNMASSKCKMIHKLKCNVLMRRRLDWCQLWCNHFQKAKKYMKQRNKYFFPK